MSFVIQLFSHHTYFTEALLIKLTLKGDCVMNNQQVQNCTQATVICMINAYVDTLVEKYRAYRAAIRTKQERKQVYQQFKKMNQEGLRDIGMDDPQKQLQTLGRYL